MEKVRRVLNASRLDSEARQLNVSTWTILLVLVHNPINP